MQFYECCALNDHLFQFCLLPLPAWSDWTTERLHIDVDLTSCQNTRWAEGRIYMRQLAPSDRTTANTWRLAGQGWGRQSENVKYLFCNDWELILSTDFPPTPTSGRGKKLGMSNKWWHDPNICHSHATITQKMKWPMNMASLTETSQSCITTRQSSHDVHINNILYPRRHSYYASSLGK